MKPKTLVILLIILGVLAGGVTLLIHSRDAHSPSGGMGATLFEGLPINDIAAIHIKTPTAAVSLKKTADGWMIAERFGYRADFARLTDLVRTLKEIKIGRKFDASEEVVKRLALVPPDAAAAREGERGTRIWMTDSAGAPILDVVLGKTRTKDPQKGPPDGQYVMVSNSHEIYLIDKILSSFESGPTQWLEKSPVQVDDEAIRKIVCLGPDGTTVRYAVERPARGRDFLWKSPPTERDIKKSSLNRLVNVLSSLAIEDVETASEGSKTITGDGACCLDYTLFDGRVYRVHPSKGCSATISCRIQIEVHYDAPETQMDEDQKGPQSEGEGSAAAHGETEAPAADTAAQENDRLTRWVFTIPEWQYQAFFTDPEELLEKEAER